MLPTVLYPVDVLLSIIDYNLMLIFLVFSFSLFVRWLEIDMAHVLYFSYLSQNQFEQLLILYTDSNAA